MWKLILRYNDLTYSSELIGAAVRCTEVLGARWVFTHLSLLCEFPYEDQVIPVGDMDTHGLTAVAYSRVGVDEPFGARCHDSPHESMVNHHQADTVKCLANRGPSGRRLIFVKTWQDRTRPFAESHCIGLSSLILTSVYSLWVRGFKELWFVRVFILALGLSSSPAFAHKEREQDPKGFPLGGVERLLVNGQGAQSREGPRLRPLPELKWAIKISAQGAEMLLADNPVRRNSREASSRGAGLVCLPSEGSDLDGFYRPDLQRSVLFLSTCVVNKRE